MVLLVAQIGLALALNMSNKGIGEGAPDTLFLSFSPDAGAFPGNHRWRR